MLTDKEVKTLLVADEDTFFRLVEEIEKRIEAKRQPEPEEWISEAQAMAMLHIKSKTTLWKLRMNGSLIYSTISSKHFLYSRSSILELINEKKQDKF